MGESPSSSPNHSGQPNFHNSLPQLKTLPAPLKTMLAPLTTMVAPLKTISAQLKTLPCGSPATPAKALAFQEVSGMAPNQVYHVWTQDGPTS
jgi:hypothetical protein